MTQDQLEKEITATVAEWEGARGVVQFNYQGVSMMVISDVSHDRMRIIAPIVDYDDIPESQKDAMMESNFHAALDARYALSDDVLYSAFIHPLSCLTKQELESALDQVATLALTFGSSYSSGKLVFGEPTAPSVAH